MKHHVPIDAPGRARPVASTANMYTLASVRLLSFWLTAIYISLTPTRTVRASNARECIYTFIHSCGRGNGARATRRRLWARDVSSQAGRPSPAPFSMFPSPAQLNARTKSRNGEGLGPRLPNCMMTLIMQIMQSILKCTILNLFRTVLLVLHMHSTLHVVSLV